MVRRFVQFNAVGALGIGVQLGVLWMLADVVGVGYLPATVLAVVVTVLHNFTWHLAWTWADRPAARGALFATGLRFALANGAVSLFGNMTAMAVLVGGLGLPAVRANVLAIAGCGLVNFWLGDRVVFR